MTKKKKRLLIKIIIILNILLVILLTIYLILKRETSDTNTTLNNDRNEEISAPPTTTTANPPGQKTFETIGYSVENRSIDIYTFGQGSTTLLFVGGIHGGYEWNSVLLAYKFIDEIESGKMTLPESFTIKIIPSLNPDGVNRITGKEGRFEINDIKIDTKNGEGRFNANSVDLNRNFACKWQPNSTWRNKYVSGGTSAFSEPESQTLKKVVEENELQAVIFWHSQANAVYASECEEGILPETLRIMDAYANSSGYKAIKTFDAYPVTGDAEGWLASIGIPAITVELGSHDDIEWEKNKAGVESIFELYR